MVQEIKSKVIITEQMYQTASNQNDYKTLKNLLSSESSDFVEIKRRIIKYNLLEIAVKSNDYSFVRNVLIYQQINTKLFNFEELFLQVVNNKNSGILRILNDSFLKSSIIQEKKKNGNNNNNKEKYKYINFILNMIIKTKNEDNCKFFMENEYYSYSKENINIKDINGVSPIITSVNYYNYNIFKYLLSKGADIDTKSNSGMSLLFYAINKNDLDMIFLLFEYAEKNQYTFPSYTSDNSGNTPLILSYKKGYIDIFKYLIQYFDINNSDDSGNTCLNYAINNEDVDMVKYLIKNGTKIDISHLHKAICKKDDLFDLFLENELINLNEKFNGKPLFKVIYETVFDKKKRKTLFEKIINKGYNVNLTDEKGYTPLNYAIEHNDMSIIELLFKNGANLDKYYLKKQSPLHRSIKKGFHKISKYLYDNGARVVDINDFEYEDVTKILGNYCSINKNLLLLLLSNNLKINSLKNSEGDTLLNYAIRNHNEEMVEFLLENGADKTIKNNEGENAEDVNKKYNKNSLYYSIILLLKKY
eukprot:jgi/Orpsp1_1/1185563/evm.model.c7180000094375.1